MELTLSQTCLRVHRWRGGGGQLNGKESPKEDRMLEASGGLIATNIMIMLGKRVQN